VTALYDEIGRTYGRYRRPDPRIERVILEALGGARTILNVGAGSGSYEPQSAGVVALEPSRTMIVQRRAEAAPVVQAVAGALPFRDDAFDASLAILTIHHWPDADAGLREMQRVSTRQVVLTWDPEVTGRFWLVDEYVPEVREREADLAAVDEACAALAESRVVPVMVPRDCTDGFFGGYWGRPERYLDPDARAAISGLALLPEDVLARAMRQLESDLTDGTWAARHPELAAGLSELDIGYRLVIRG
jgi:SAM-dependent methyltransferase